MWWLLLVGVGVAAASELFKRRKLSGLPDISDEKFLKAYKHQFASSDRAVIEERRLIAQCLGLPHQKLSPTHRFDTLSEYTGFATEYEVGMGDLADDLFDLFERAGMAAPSFPETVGELIHQTIRAKEKISALQTGL
jgi:hypothetical protein